MRTIPEKESLTIEFKSDRSGYSDADLVDEIVGMANTQGADMGLRNAAIHYRQIEITHIIENLVYLELLRRGYIVDIGKNREKEIDFVAKELSGKQYYIQVSYTIQDEVTKEREISAFRRLDDGYKKILITMDRNPLSNLENGYQMMHLFDFLLNDQALETV